MKPKSIITIGFLLICTITNINADDVKNLQSKLEEATIFYRGAELKHSASAMLSKGDNVLTIDGLSPTIDPNSIRIKTSEGVMVSSYEFVEEMVLKNDYEQIRKRISDSIDIYRNKIKIIDVETGVNKDMHELFGKSITQKILGTERDSSHRNMSIDELIKSVDYYKDKSLEVGTFLMKKNDEKELYKAEINKLSNRLALYKDEKLSVKRLKINAVASNAKTAQFTVSYTTYAAGWRPFYNLNVISTEKPIQIISKAKVFQTTGIDWEQVKITLSTGMPNKGKIAPLFHTWFLQEYQVRSHDELSSVQNAYVYSEARVVADMELSLKDNTLDDYVTMNDNQLMTTYKIDLPYTIPGNGKEQNLDLRIQEANAAYHFYCAPKLDTDSYLLAEVIDSEKLDLPRGNAQITYDGMTLGETIIDGSSTLKNLTLTLGSDNRVSVKREKLHDFSSTKTFGSDVKQTFTYKITVKNNQSKAVKMVLKDQYPTSTQKNIEVELLKETTAPTFNIKETGVLTWEETLAPGETKTYLISYSVKYPKNMSLNI